MTAVDKQLGGSALTALLVAGCLVVLTGCGAGQEGELGEPSLEAAAIPASPDSLAAALPLPDRGAARVEVSGGRVTVISNGAGRVSVLDRLAQMGGFELELGAFEDRPLFARVERADLRSALPILIAGSAYSVDYRFVPELGAHALARLRLGEALPAGSAAGSPESGLTASLPSEGSELDPSARRESSEGATAEPAGGLAGLATALARGAASQADPHREAERASLRAELESSDPDDRASAVADIEPEGEGLELLVDLLAGDPDPGVRTAAAEQLADGEGYAAVRALVDALADPDREVVLEAIESLELAGDASVVPDLEPLLEHPDAEIRGAAEEALDFLAF